MRTSIFLLFSSLFLFSCNDETDLLDKTNDLDNDLSSEIVDKEPEPLTEYLRPTLTEGKKWVMAERFYTDDPDNIYTLTVGVDTVYEGHTAKTIMREDKYGGPRLSSFMYEDNGAAYEYLDINSGKSDINGPIYYKFYGKQYDMNAQCGDSIGANPYYTMRDGFVIVVSRGTIVLMGKTRRALKVYCYFMRANYHYDYWVEGIGPLFYGVPYYNIIRPTGFPYIYRRVMECYDGDEKIYDFSEFDESLYTPTEFFEGLEPIR